MKIMMVAASAICLTVSVSAFAQMGGQDPYGDAAVAKADYIKTAMAQFDALDTNKNGAISADEIAAAAQGMGGRGLARADANGDGAVSKDEFTTAQNNRFDMMDADKDGQLTRAERDAFRQQMMQRMQAANPGN